MIMITITITIMIMIMIIILIITITCYLTWVNPLAKAVIKGCPEQLN